MKAAAMLQTYPGTVTLDRELLARAIDTLLTCSQACTACADACLAEDMVAELRGCIRTDLDCADVCDTAARILSRNTAVQPEITRAVLGACIAACRTCGDECEQHSSMHEHCRICAEACRQCEEACSELLGTLG